MKSTGVEQREIVLKGALRERLLASVRDRFPFKSFGYLLAEGDSPDAIDFVLFYENVRNEKDFRKQFQSYGRYFVDHDDAGFVASPEETWRVHKELWERRQTPVAVFHSHRRHPANFSLIDYELHLQGCEGLWHVIISMRNPELPQLRAFGVSREGVRELMVRAPDA